MSGDSIDELSRLLFVTFLESDHIEHSDLVRLWSLELQWMEPNEATLVIEKLLKSGWLISQDNILRPIKGIKEIFPGLGWRPIFRMISNPPIFVAEYVDISKDNESSISEIVVKVIPSKSVSPQVIDRPPDRSEGNIPRLIKLIAEKSRLENREVVRRAQRKRRSLGPVTLWMALALVAREQGLDMVEIVSVIETV